jgi:signal transduction histidine kinase
VDELKALAQISQTVSSTLELEAVLASIVAHAVALSASDAGTIYEYEEAAEEFHVRVAHRTSDEIMAALRTAPLKLGEGAMGRAGAARDVVQVADLVSDRAHERRVGDLLVREGFRALLAVPLLREDRIVGGLVVRRRAAGEFSAQTIALLKTFAAQSALAIQNARLFREIADKSRELEVASRHKSQFLANMSHELRTPLNAIIGVTEMLLEDAHADRPGDVEPLERVLRAGRHLLNLINDILDLSKVEAGRMELDLSAVDLRATIDVAVTLVRERAARRRITLEHLVDDRLGEVRADERKIRQVLLNLLSNAVKFTPDGGRIDVRASLGEGVVEVAVTDTGIGIAADDQEAIFDEFHQVGPADQKAGGTGLGLALCRRFVELHGGRIWVKSTVGAGSTFTFTLPR